MRAYESNREMTRKRIKKVQSKAKFAGWLYLLGTIAMAVLACLSVVQVEGHQFWAEKLSIGNFLEPIKSLKNVGVSVDLIVSVLYLFVLLAVIINVLKCWGKLSRLTKRSAVKLNRNRDAMERMGKIFSGSFAVVVIFHFLFFVLLQGVKLNMFGYVALAAGVFIHLLAGIVEGKVGKFDNQASIEEHKRETGLFVYFVRNFLQIAAVVGIIYFFVKGSTISTHVPALLKGDMAALTGDIMVLVSFALQIVAVISIMVLIKHATATTEFNFWGIDGPGMKNYRVFSFFTFIAAAGIFAVGMLNLPEGEKTDWTFAIVAAIALVIFVLDCIMKSRRKKAERRAERFENRPPVARPAAPAQAMRMPMQVQPQVCQPVIYVQAPPPMPCPAMSRGGSPCVPPMHAQMPMNAPAQMPMSAPMQMPAPAPQQPAPAPAAPVAPVAPVVAPASTPAPVEAPSYEEEAPAKVWKVACPNCKKTLSVKDTRFNRCPSCGKVFQIRKGQRTVEVPPAPAFERPPLDFSFDDNI